VALWTILIILAFVCGSIPFGLLIARAKGLDIRQHGSGNIGATNVGRVLGKRLGMACFALDVLKGLIPTFSAGLIMQLVREGIVAQAIASTSAWLWLCVMTAAVLGHIFSPWIGFRGGKGVATGLGAMLGLFPYLTVPALAALLVWLATAWAFRYVSLASCTAAVALPLLVLAWGAASARFTAGAGTLPAGFWPFVVVTALLGALVVIKHRANIQRLLAGNENRIGQRAGIAR
jgi:acyl phosphate:glycerol-3-phosphate acyltransferase